jgi:hypothetical protein
MPLIQGLKDKAEHAERAAEQWEAQSRRCLGGFFMNKELVDAGLAAVAEAEAWRAKAAQYRKLMESCPHASLLWETGADSLKVTCVDCGKTEAAGPSLPPLTMGVFAGFVYDDFKGKGR